MMKLNFTLLLRNLYEQVKTGFGFIFDWMKKLREFFEPVTAGSNVKPIALSMIVCTYVVSILCILVSFLYSCTVFRVQRSVVLQSPLATWRERFCEFIILGRVVQGIIKLI